MLSRLLQSLRAHGSSKQQLNTKRTDGETRRVRQAEGKKEKRHRQQFSLGRSVFA